MEQFVCLWQPLSKETTLEWNFIMICIGTSLDIHRLSCIGCKSHQVLRDFKVLKVSLPVVDTVSCQLNAIAKTRATLKFNGLHIFAQCVTILWTKFQMIAQCPPIKPFMTPMPNFFSLRSTPELKTVPSLCTDILIKKLDKLKYDNNKKGAKN